MVSNSFSTPLQALNLPQYTYIYILSALGVEPELLSNEFNHRKSGVDWRILLEDKASRGVYPNTIQISHLAPGEYTGDDVGK
jgi:hypothetical protein